MGLQYYRVDETLLKHQLIVLDKIEVPQEMKENDITVCVREDGKAVISEKCHIDSTQMHRLRVPYSIVAWIKKNYPFTVAYIASGNQVVWDNYSLKKIGDAYKKKEKLDKPIEAIGLSWEMDENGNYVLVITKSNNLTIERAKELLSDEALVSIYPFIYSSITNVYSSQSNDEKMLDGKLGDILDKTTPWLSAKEYGGMAFPYGGLYILRRKTTTGDYAYYVGKANNINKRIAVIEDKNNDCKLVHPDEKNNSAKHYDSIMCMSVDAERYNSLFNSNGKMTEEQREMVLFYTEDIAIHCVLMVLKSEGKILDNIQYKAFTSNIIG